MLRDHLARADDRQLDAEPLGSEQAADGDAFLTLNVSLADGSHFKPEAVSGFRIMELIRAYGLPIKAECGGSGICGGCHVRIAQGWRDRLPAASGDELLKLDEIANADESSRLACQLVMTADLDGLELEIQPDSLWPQTSWVAG